MTGTDYKIPVSTLVVVYTAKLDVLLLERADRPGYWQSVTGSQHVGETLEQTATRELEEETGLRASDHALSAWNLRNEYEIYAIWRHRYAPGVTRNTEHVFGLKVNDRVPVRLSPREHLQSAWMPWREAAAKVFSWSNRQAIESLPQRQDA